MTVASEITDLNTNLQAAKAAVTAKGGTVGDTGLAGLAAEIQTIPNGGGSTEPSSGGHITGYDTATGVITGDGFGSTQGTVYLLDRDTNSYVSQPVSSWSDTSITLTTPIDLSVIEGNTSLSVVDSNGLWATKWMVYGNVPVAGFMKIYVQDTSTRTIRTVTMPNSTGVNRLFNSAATRSITIGSDTFYSDEIVGIQFGEDFDTTVFNSNSYFLSACTSLNQPVIVPEGTTALGTYFLSQCYSLNQPVRLPSTVTSLPGYFMYYVCNFNQSLDLSNITSIGTYFMEYATMFDQPLDLSSVTSVGDNFLVYCQTFNQDFDLSSATTIGTYFLCGDTKFNGELALSSSLTVIATGFLNQCSSFNRPLDFSNVVTIGDNVLSGRIASSYSRGMAFNQPLTLSNVTTVGNYFLYYCSAFNQPLIFGKAVVIGDEVLQGAIALNSPITFSASPTTIGGNFLASATNFNQPLDLTNVTSLGGGFLQNCTSFNQPLHLPSTLTFANNANWVLNAALAFTELIVDTPSYPTGSNCFCGGSYGSQSKTYLKGITVTGTEAATWIANLPNQGAPYYRKLINGN